MSAKNVREFLGSRAGLAATLVLAGLGVYLLVTHTGHMLAALPYLALLACPLMHLMHAGHHHGSHHAATAKPASDDARRP